MAIPVHRDLVSRRGDLRRQRRIALDLLADEEEDGWGPGQRIEDRRGALGVWAVVEGEGDTGGGEPASYAERGCDGRGVRCQPRPEPRRCRGQRE